MKAIINTDEANEMLKNKPFRKLGKEWLDIDHTDTEAMKKFLDENPEFVQMAMNYAEKVVVEVLEE